MLFRTAVAVPDSGVDEGGQAVVERDAGPLPAATNYVLTPTVCLSPSHFSLSQSPFPSAIVEEVARSPGSSFHPAGAGAVLSGTTAAGIGLGALFGWAVGSWSLGALAGGVVGIPAGVYAVYRRYRGFFE